MIIAWLIHSIYATAIAFVLSHLAGGLNPTVSAVSLLIGGYFGYRHAKRLNETQADLKFFSFAQGETGVMEALIFAFVTFAAWRHFTWIFYVADTNWMTLAANNFGDLPMHVNFIRALSNGIPFPPVNPEFAAEALRYPFGPDLYSALWESLGVRLSAHLCIVGFIASLASLQLLRTFGSWWAMGAFFLSGGLAGWQILNGSRLRDFQGSVDWKNLFLSVFVTQRGMLFALPLGLLLLILVRRHLSGERQLDRYRLWILGLLWGLMPLFHLHAFVIVSLMLALIAFEFGGFKGVARFLRSPMALVAYVPAIFFVLRSTDFLKRSAGIVHLSWGWTAKEGSFPNFYFANFGPWLLVPLVLAVALFYSKGLFPVEKRRRLWFEFGTYCFLFIVFFNVILAPWEWDNIKILVWPYLGFARLLYVVLEPRMGLWLGWFERPFLGLVLFLSGLVAILFTLQSPVGRAVMLYTVGELANVEGALADVPKTAVFAASPTHQHPLTYFGRLRALGYEGHLWSHGIDSKATREKLDLLMEGDPDFVRLAREIGVTHIFWGPDERLKFGTRQRVWMDVLKNVSRVPGVEIYVVQ